MIAPFIKQLFSMDPVGIIIFIKIVLSITYLILNYVTHKLGIPVLLANILRFCISCFDFVLLLVLIFNYIRESCVMAYGYSIIGILYFIFMCALQSAILIRQDSRVQPVFIIGTFSLIALVVLYIQFFSMGLGYKGTMSALFILNGLYCGGYLIFDPYAKTISRFMVSIGDKLSWIDPLIGPAPKEVALRNLCSFFLGLLNLAYLHVSGGAVSIFICSLIALGLIVNLLIGLRLLRESESVKLHESGFIGQILINAYSNITTIYAQIKSNNLPRARWSAWVMILGYGLVFTSPSYAMSPIEEIIPEIEPSPFEIGEPQNHEIFQTADSGEPVGESYIRQLSRRASSWLGESFQHNKEEFLKRAHSMPADISYEAVKAGLAATLGAAGYQAYEYTSVLGEGSEIQQQSNQPDTSTQKPSYDELVEANRTLVPTNEKLVNTNAELVKENLDKSNRILALQQKSSWFSWLKSCWKRSSD